MAEIAETLEKQIEVVEAVTSAKVISYSPIFYAEVRVERGSINAALVDAIWQATGSPETIEFSVIVDDGNVAYDYMRTPRRPSWLVTQINSAKP